MSALSPFITTYATPTPYITEAEFRNAPTAIDISDLVQDGTAAQQTQVLVDTIQRASSWVDEIVNQSLSATLDIEQGTYRVNRDGYVSVPLRFKPVLEVQAVSVGLRSSQMVAITDFSDVQVNEYSVKIPVFPLNLPSAQWGVGSKLLVNTTYVNGWANTLTSAATTTTPPQSNIPVTGALGIYPGSSLTLFDGVNTETVTVSPTYAAGSLTVLLTAPLTKVHTAGVSVSNLPAKVKEAAILLTTVLIQTRGNDSIVLDSLDQPMRVVGQSSADKANVVLATELLQTLQRVW